MTGVYLLDLIHQSPLIITKNCKMAENVHAFELQMKKTEEMVST